MKNRIKSRAWNLFFAIIITAIICIFCPSARANSGDGPTGPSGPIGSAGINLTLGGATPVIPTAPKNQPISIGRTVIYRHRHRITGELIERPAIAVRVWSPECANLQVFMDGDGGPSNDAEPNLLWATSASYQAEEDGSELRHGTWFWPKFVRPLPAGAGA